MKWSARQIEKRTIRSAPLGTATISGVISVLVIGCSFILANLRIFE